MLDALHPQTILAYGMNGRDLPLGHGAPLRLRVETQVGYKSMKFLRRIVVTDDFDDNGAQGAIQNGWSWYAGIRITSYNVCYTKLLRVPSAVCRPARCARC